MGGCDTLILKAVRPAWTKSPTLRFSTTRLVSLGFRDVYTLATYHCRGSLIFLQLAYPHGWTVCHPPSAPLPTRLGPGFLPILSAYTLPSTRP